MNLAQGGIGQSFVANLDERLTRLDPVSQMRIA